MILRLSLQYIISIVEDKTIAMAVLAMIPTPSSYASEQEMTMAKEEEEDDDDDNRNDLKLWETRRNHPTPSSSSNTNHNDDDPPWILSTRPKQYLRDVLIEPLCTILTGVEYSSDVSIFESACACLILIFDQMKWILLSNPSRKTNSSSCSSSTSRIRTVTKSQTSQITLQHQHLSIMTDLFRWIDSIIKQPTHSLTSIENTSNEIYMLQPSNKLKSVLPLLLSIIRCPGYDPVALQFWSTFYPATLDSKSHSLTSLLSLSLISTEHSIHYAILALSISLEYIKLLPHRLWNSPMGSNYNNQGHLWNRVQSSLKCLVDTSCSTLSYTIKAISLESSPNLRDVYFSLMIELSHLLKVVVTVVPFNPLDAYDPKSVLNSTITMLQMIGEFVVTSLTDANLELHAVKACIHDLSSCMGGSETPDGSITPMPLPMKLWIHREAHEPQRRNSFLVSLLKFTDRCLQHHDEVSCLDYDANISINRELLPDAVRLLTYILRVSDEIFLELYDKSAHNSMSSLILATVSALNTHGSVDLRRMGSQIIQAIFRGNLLGKVSELDGITRKALLRLLPALLGDEDVDVKSCSLTTVGSLTIEDWEWIFGGNVEDIFHQILSYCLEYSGPVHSNVRSEACKSLGKIVSIILAALVPDITKNIGDRKYDRYSFVLRMIDDAVQVAITSLNDSQADVRGMALFTIGNVASVISTIRLDLKIMDNLVVILESVAYHLNDANDKVRIKTYLCPDNLYESI